MRRSKRYIPLLALVIAVLTAQSVGGRLVVRCADGSPCPLSQVEPKPCCQHKPCHKPLLPTCIVAKTPSVETTKPKPADTPTDPVLHLALAVPVAELDTSSLQRSFVRVPDSDDSPPPTLPTLSVLGPRPPPAV